MLFTNETQETVLTLTDKIGVKRPESIYILDKDWVPTSDGTHYQEEDDFDVAIFFNEHFVALAYQSHAMYEVDHPFFSHDNAIEYLVWGDSKQFDEAEPKHRVDGEYRFGSDNEGHEFTWFYGGSLPTIEDSVSQATNKDDGEKVSIAIHYDGVSVTDADGKVHEISKSEAMELYGHLSVGRMVDVLEKRFS